jgi:hypothetical protein
LLLKILQYGFRVLQAKGINLAAIRAPAFRAAVFRLL